ncbi:hypothetical protein K788_00036960 (plasmid) [Paraburkholderia caribensis MBA4]|uniref:Uncharacterized protein n=1 Tax=Paraburkholderia caribensis MBA4 TaxID=1323664 RepID=A0A0N7JWC8_9BURK|nr:hypothetical protein K788_00036960 [Paraburkholderia caribensis MBA4]
MDRCVGERVESPGGEFQLAIEPGEGFAFVAA